MKLVAVATVLGLSLAAMSQASAQTIGFAEAADQLGMFCGADIDKHCKGVNLGEDRLRSCLANTPAVSQRCKTALTFVIQSLNTRLAAQAASVKLCEADYRQLCGMVQIGDGNVLDCLLKAQRAVSPKCNKALTDAGWR